LKKTLLCLFACFVFAPTQAGAATVRRASIDELAQASVVIFRGIVRSVNNELEAKETGLLETAIEFEVLESIKGLRPKAKRFSLVLPGGKVHGREMRIPGIPKFALGEEVVVLLEANSGRYVLTGLSQGVFWIDRVNGVASLRRNFRETHFIDTPSFERPSLSTNKVRSLAELVNRLRGKVK